MTDYLKLTLTAVLISVLSMGCKEDSAKPEKQTEVAAFTVSSSTFKDGVLDYESTHEKVTVPHIEWKNAPAGTKGFILMIEDINGHTYFSDNFLENINSSQNSTRKIKLPDETIANSKIIIEVFALASQPNDFATRIEEKMSEDEFYGPEAFC